ncbi:MAG TPA: outer membrane beta-barrel protein [Longimicrobiales bacterium]|nr:outer membrane beta-barrel protein [Longimicrobiales bacterium]
MKKAVVLSALVSLTTVTPLAAQFGPVEQPPQTWASGWLGGYLDPGTVRDPEDGAWSFGSSFAAGLGLHRQIGNSLSIGVDASYAPMRFEQRDVATEEVLSSGTARVISAMASARLRYGGGDAFGMYLTGGVGTMAYGMPDPVDRWDTDLALHTGAGLEYRPSINRALFVEWGRYWTFHQNEGIDDNTTQHSQLRIGVRTGF